MIKKRLIFITILTVALTLLLSGCAGGGDDLEGKNIVTFEVNGGTLSYGTSSTDTKLNFAYHPGTYIIDPTEIPNYFISRSGYNFTGWYTSAECKPNEKFNFSQAFNDPTLTLYAGWERAIKHTYTLYYIDGENSVSLGTYDVRAGEKFEDWRGYADKRDGFTSIGYFSDAALSAEWDFSTVHPGGDTDLDIPVYVKYIDGEWELADSYDTLKSALKSGNVYLTKDIDCEGETLSIDSFNKIFEGNGFKVSNFTVEKSGTTFVPTVSIFKSLGASADIRNVDFENVTFEFLDINENSGVVPNVAALTKDMSAGAKVTNVSVTGTIKTNYDKELPRLNSVYYYKDSADEAVLAGVNNFTANITVDKQS